MTQVNGRVQSISIDGDSNTKGVAEYLLASKKCEILALEQLLGMGQLLAKISNLVHALQLERGASNMYLGSGGERCADICTRQVIAAGIAEKQFRECLDLASGINDGCLAGDSRLFSRIAYAIHGLDELRTVRQDIKHLKAAPESIIDGYSALIQSLLAIVYETADSAADPGISRVLVAMFHLMQGKELAGQERAVGSAGFAQGRFDHNFSTRLRRLIESQERCFQIFTNFADTEALQSWERISSSQSSAMLERLRRIAFSSASDGKTDCDLSDAWFSVTSERIDAIKHMEHRIEASLSDLCRAKIVHARQDLDSHRIHIDALSKQAKQTGSPSFAVFFSATPNGNLRDSNPETYDTGCAGPQLGRSLFDLVQLQSERLQTMTEELEAAKEALTERKTIEKAKGLIMKSRRVGEDEAYRFLRQVAMAQNRKLVEVAKDTLAMADLFPMSE